MGLGKTLQTIAFIAHLAEIGEPGPHLIVVPSATLENWLKEFQRFAPGLIVKPYYGSIPEREMMRMQYEEDRDTQQVNVLVTTYVIAKAKEDSRWLKNYGFTCTVYDEGHQLKNPTSDVASKLTKIRSKFRLLLTGTPLQNNLHELMGLLKFLMPDIFERKEEDLQAIFKQQVHTITEDTSSRQMLLSKQRIERARSMLTPFILRRKKWQVLKDLPKKERKVEYCDMTPEQHEIYSQWIAKAWDVRDRKMRGERVPADESANVLVRLRQAAIHPLLFRYFYKDRTLQKIAKTCPKIDVFHQSNPEFIMKELVEYADFETHALCSKHKLLNPYMLDDDKWEVSGKVQALLRLLATFQKEGHRTLVFSQFVMVLDILERVLTSQEIKYLRLDGSTKVDERQDLIDEFNAEGSDIPVFMLSTKAGGAGINLASANRVIVFDSGFNPQDDVQAENRAHRIGQTKDVEVWRLITKGTVEEQIYDMGLVKLKLDQEVAGEALDGPAGAAEANAEEQQDSKNGKKDTSGGLSKTEQEGAKVVEDLLFKKLEAEGPISPAKTKTKTHALDLYHQQLKVLALLFQSLAEHLLRRPNLIKPEHHILITNHNIDPILSLAHNLTVRISQTLEQHQYLANTAEMSTSAYDLMTSQAMLTYALARAKTAICTKWVSRHRGWFESVPPRAGQFHQLATLEVYVLRMRRAIRWVLGVAMRQPFLTERAEKWIDEFVPRFVHLQAEIEDRRSRRSDVGILVEPVITEMGWNGVDWVGWSGMGRE